MVVGEVEGEARRFWFCLETRNDLGDIILNVPRRPYPKGLAFEGSVVLDRVRRWTSPVRYEAKTFKGQLCDGRSGQLPSLRSFVWSGPAKEPTGRRQITKRIPGTVGELMLVRNACRCVRQKVSLFLFRGGGLEASGSSCLVVLCT